MTDVTRAGIGFVMMLGLMTLGFAVVYRGTPWRMPHETLRSTMRTSALSLLTVTAAFSLDFVMGSVPGNPASSPRCGNSWTMRTVRCIQTCRSATG